MAVLPCSSSSLTSMKEVLLEFFCKLDLSLNKRFYHHPLLGVRLLVGHDVMAYQQSPDVFHLLITCDLQDRLEVHVPLLHTHTSILWLSHQGAVLIISQIVQPFLLVLLVIMDCNKFGQKNAKLFLLN